MLSNASAERTGGGPDASLTIAFATRSVPIHGRAPWERCLGGSESAMVFAARALAARGHHVDVFARCDAPGVYDDVTYHDVAALDEHARVRDWDVFVSLRFPDLLEKDIRAALRVLWCQDVVAQRPMEQVLSWADLLVFVSHWHRDTTVAAHPGLASASAVVPNGVDLSMFGTPDPVSPPLLVHLSRPERGLRPLLAAWPSIRARVPEARLAVARYRSFHEPAGSEIEAFCLRMDQAVRATPGAETVGNLSKPALYALLSRATAMVYPAEFDETSCIAAIEAQAAGLPVVATRRGALPETLHPDAAWLLEPGAGMVERFADRVVELLHEPDARAAMSAAGRRHAEGYDAARIAEAWERLFLDRLHARAERDAARIERTLTSRGDLPGDARPGPGQARWPGFGPQLQAAIRARVGDAPAVRVVGPLQEVAAFVGVPVRDDAHVVVDAGGLLCAEDRAANLASFADRRVVHVLPAAPGSPLPGQRVFPTYGDVARWFGPEADIACTVEVAGDWGDPARCWVVACDPGTALGLADEPARKRVLTRATPTVSACLIVRDAADTVLTALTSLLPVADEVRVVDTGSRDRTVELVADFAARSPVPVRLRAEAWPDDFAAARNLSMEGAEGDWILWIDADERLLGAERLRRLLQTSHWEAYAIRQHNHIFDHAVTHVEHPFRVFRNGRGYRFYGAIHEHPERALNEVIEPWTVAPGVDILHYGYLTEPTRRRKLLKRNLALLEQDLRCYPGRRLTDVLYLRDAVNLARFDLERGPLRPDHREALEAALARFEAVCMPARDRYYRLGREYYDQGLTLLGQGADLHVAVGGPDTPRVRHRVRRPDDAMWLVTEQARAWVEQAARGTT